MGGGGMGELAGGEEEETIVGIYWPTRREREKDRGRKGGRKEGRLAGRQASCGEPFNPSAWGKGVETSRSPGLAG